MISFIDERFLEHRRRSTSTAGIATGITALLLGYYHFHPTNGRGTR